MDLCRILPLHPLPFSFNGKRERNGFEERERGKRRERKKERGRKSSSFVECTKVQTNNDDPESIGLNN